MNYEYHLIQSNLHPITLLHIPSETGMSKILLLGASQSNNPILLTQPSRTSLSDYKAFDMRLLRLYKQDKSIVGSDSFMKSNTIYFWV